MGVRLAINGFGRTGRALLRAARRPELGLEVVAVNDLGSAQRWRSCWRATRCTVGSMWPSGSTATRWWWATSGADAGGARYKGAALEHPRGRRGGGIDGRFTGREKAAAHLDAGARLSSRPRRRGSVRGGGWRPRFRRAEADRAADRGLGPALPRQRGYCRETRWPESPGRVFLRGPSTRCT